MPPVHAGPGPGDLPLAGKFALYFHHYDIAGKKLFTMRFG